MNVIISHYIPLWLSTQANINIKAGNIKQWLLVTLNTSFKIYKVIYTLSLNFFFFYYFESLRKFERKTFQQKIVIPPLLVHPTFFSSTHVLRRLWAVLGLAFLEMLLQGFQKTRFFGRPGIFPKTFKKISEDYSLKVLYNFVHYLCDWFLMIHIAYFGRKICLLRWFFVSFSF